METLELSTSLRSTISALYKALRKETHAANTFSMTELETIAHIFKNEAMLPTQLATLTRIKTQSMSPILKKLEENGLIKRVLSKEDGRKVYISLTGNGNKMVEKNRYEKDEWLKNAIENSLNTKEKELLIKVLPVLNKLAASK